MKKDIILVVGKSSCGKDFITNELCKRYDFKKMVSYTTRPKRPNEVDGVDYHFIESNEKFDEMFDNGELFEKTEYKTVNGVWKYGFGNKSVNENCVNIAIVNPHGINQMIESSINDRLQIVYVFSQSDYNRLKRYESRLGRDMTIQEKAEAFDRVLRDEKDFEEFASIYNIERGYYKKIPMTFAINNYVEDKTNEMIEGIFEDVLYEM